MQLLINSENWKIFANRIASPSPPEDYNEAAIERLMDVIHLYCVDVKNIRPQFRALNKILMIDFESIGEREYYQQAFERYLESINKIKAAGDESVGSSFLILVEWLKFRQAAEFIRRKWIARNMYYAVQEGYAAGCACNFKATIAGIVLELHTKFKVKRSDISLIWGGDSIYTSAPEDLYTDIEIQDILTSVTQGKEVKMSVLNNVKRQLQAQNAGLGDIPAGLDLGPQNFVRRQEEIDRYQKGDSLYGLYSFKSGGIGLSLHHSDQFTQQKCRKKPNGYSYIEDIPLIPTRPRRSFLAPTYSAIELVQGLGRFPRIFSLSDTMQTLVFYLGTIEQQVAFTVSRKLKCLSKVVRQKEDWQDLVVNSKIHDKNASVIPDEEVIDSTDEMNNLQIDDDNEEENDN